MSNRLKKRKLEQQQKKEQGPQLYSVYVDDNFSYMNDDARFTAGEFATYEEALAEARDIVRSSVRETFKPGMTRKELMDQYKHFGLDPFISPGLKGQPQFSAWDYANDVADDLLADRSTSVT